MCCVVCYPLLNDTKVKLTFDIRKLNLIISLYAIINAVFILSKLKILGNSYVYIGI